MPLYEYRCDRGHKFEVMQRMSDDPVTTCSTCDAPVQRVFHPVAVHFKGSGFYTTDYGRKKRGSSSDDSGSSSDDSGGKDSGKASAKGSGDKKPDKSGSGSGGGGSGSD
jgi:putative FmdB family regulatory protein